jgi:hypothetical protein
MKVHEAITLLHSPPEPPRRRTHHVWVTFKLYNRKQSPHELLISHKTLAIPDHQDPTFGPVTYSLILSESKEKSFKNITERGRSGSRFLYLHLPFARVLDCRDHLGGAEGQAPPSLLFNRREQGLISQAKLKSLDYQLMK